MYVSVPSGPSDAVLNDYQDEDEVRAKCVPTAVIYCEANLGRVDGKTANGLVRHCESTRSWQS